MVQLVLDIYRSISTSLYVRTKDGKPVGLDARELKRLARRTVGNTLKGIASLLLASLGAGLGTVLIRPSTGTWIGMFASTSILHNGLLNVRWYHGWSCISCHKLIFPSVKPFVFQIFYVHNRVQPWMFCYQLFLVNVVFSWHVIQCECRLCCWRFCRTISCRYLVGHLDCVWHLHSWRRPRPIRIPSHMGTSLRQFESCYFLLASLRKSAQDRCSHFFLRRLGCLKIWAPLEWQHCQN